MPSATTSYSVLSWRGVGGQKSAETLSIDSKLFVSLEKLDHTLDAPIDIYALFSFELVCSLLEWGDHVLAR